MQSDFGPARIVTGELREGRCHGPFPNREVRVDSSIAAAVVATTFVTDARSKMLVTEVGTESAP